MFLNCLEDRLCQFLLVLKAITFLMLEQLTNLSEVLSYSLFVILPLTSCCRSQQRQSAFLLYKMRVLLYPVIFHLLKFPINLSVGNVFKSFLHNLLAFAFLLIHFLL